MQQCGQWVGSLFRGSPSFVGGCLARALVSRSPLPKQSRALVNGHNTLGNFERFRTVDDQAGAFLRDHAEACGDHARGTVSLVILVSQYIPCTGRLSLLLGYSALFPVAQTAIEA